MKFSRQLANSSTKDLEILLSNIQKELHARKLSDLVEYVPNFVNDDLGNELFQECESLNLSNDNPRKAASQWLSPLDEPYIYPDSNPIHHAKDIKQFHAMSKAIDTLNNRFNCNVDSCLILKYTTSATATSLHADDEDCFDKTQPICNITLGCSRTIEFVSNGTGKKVQEILMEDKSLVLMKPGTQQALKHRVRGEGSVRKTQLRYSLSFRSLAKKAPSSLQSASVSQKLHLVPQPTIASSPSLPAAITAVSTPERHICLIAGDSYSARLDPQKLGRNHVDVVNIARGGARMHHVISQLKDFKEQNDEVIVDKLCISVGTNDIRYCINGTRHLSSKFKSLCSTIKELFPHAKVYFQLLLPLPCRNSHDWQTNTNVMSINRIIFNECIFRKFHVMDAFRAFCSPRREFRSPELRDSRLFVGRNIHPSEAKGIGVLASLYIRAIHSKYFDPYTYQ